MQIMNRKRWLTGFLGLFLFVAPTGGIAADQAASSGTDKTALEQALQTGQTVDAYAQKLGEMGYRITSTNYSDPDYVEYEVVKGDQSYEVQIDVDDNTRKATKVDVAVNMWATEATERALNMNKRTATGAKETTAEADKDSPGAYAYRYSDRDRSRTDAMIKEIEAWPTGKEKQFYRDALKQNGYTITKTNSDTEKELNLEAVKGTRSVSLGIDFDQTGKSTEIDADTMWWESAKTKEVRTGEKEKGWFDWATAPEDRKDLLLSREAYNASEPAPASLNKESIKQQVMTELEGAMTADARKNITVKVLDDGGVVLDGTVSSLGAATAAYEAVAEADDARYVVVDLDIMGAKFQQERKQPTSGQMEREPKTMETEPRAQVE